MIFTVIFKKMGVKKIKPITPGLRGKVANTFEDITFSKPEK